MSLPGHIYILSINLDVSRRFGIMRRLGFCVYSTAGSPEVECSFPIFSLVHLM